VLCINGTVVGVVSIFQRLDATEELLWILPSRAGGPDFHFGPFNYRGNGAQYFNLLWPVTLAFWWVSLRASQVLRRAGRRIGEEPYLLLLPCALLQAACPVISASHGGAVIAVCLVVGGLGVLLGANWHAAPGSRVAILVPFAVGLALAAYLGWGQYQKGLTTAFTDDMGDRIEIYQNASQMAVDHPLFGTGPATFPAIYQLYRASEKHGEAAYAHNDWLEVLITFGWLGTILLTLMLAHVFARWWISDGIECRWDFPAMIWLSMAGCLFHARFDFPFQVYSIVVLFLVLSCVTCCAARKP
jgi:O-antigen ligase